MNQLDDLSLLKKYIPKRLKTTLFILGFYFIVMKDQLIYL